MNRNDFTPYRRTTVGFDRLFDLLENAGRTMQSDNYPPFNIERIADDRYMITVAVAGFAPDEIDITAQQNQLIVRGAKEEGEQNREFLHMGIANRNFERRFQLADHIRVENANLENGLLTVELFREVPEALKPRKIAVNGVTAKTVDDEPAEDAREEQRHIRAA
ncbi:Hsp20 family protein [Novosphingopyxis sp. YJ-S2-01]|uniref:Hsp20 family protein n=1 Tax=Novosphingopyxis sp. YJ-S2-01 TaxID=2794021 RepID=UPI0018DCA3C5|nr:Hsp20 family protein [Novosphingopyxis sp. YJ-S2-01]MBH9538086.1 Hsp20 family protein [Novosphingopyxis sp. YJ-S2-01]